MSTYWLFALTVIPLIFTPGPDMLFILSQVMGKNAKAGVMATLGVCLGYFVHSFLVVVGIAAIIISFPIIFETIKWLGICYLLYLAFNLIRSALNHKNIEIKQSQVISPIRRGFITSLLNPKGMLIYFAILPQFINQHTSSIMGQGIVLSLIFIGLCLIIYSSLSFVFAFLTQKTGINEKRQKWIDGGSGVMLSLAATWLIVN
ncbi:MULTISPECIES: LysE family translocator [unclassified Acinetobacter]|uniref:LysE family translocator n=1 Tax=unclassified Acinetobacter TaxID=196816 RepID=UPI000449AA8D|nr:MULTISPECIES: LysE family translocator [unclassified Acinetobacter]EZQ10503.1 amino acid transporter [Acinetobacter sp. Ver3]SEL21564.1 Threonine/homoserine/homoserine lactone efflux protein [Acinetobacter sp. DSM 11652]